MRKPNFFIVGAPKCGTTALARYLAEHSEVLVSDPKEVHYFMHPAAGNRTIVDRKHYLSLFVNAEGRKAVGEASVWYLYSNYARQEIKKFCPSAKIIILRRNPVDFVASLHSQSIFSGHEKYHDLAYAWRKRKTQYQEGVVDSLEMAPDWITSYAELIRFDKYINKYINDFGAENVLVLSQEEFLEDKRKCYLQVLSFLGVSDDGRSVFPKVNTNKVCRSGYVQSFLHFGERQKWAMSVARKFKSLLGVGSFGLYKFIKDLNSVKAERPAIPHDLRNDIMAYYESVSRG